MLSNNKTKNHLPELLTTRYICQRLQIHQNTLKQWESKGFITVYRIGIRKDRRYLKSDILKMIREDYETPEQSNRRELFNYYADHPEILRNP